jgi:hypothetical protein
MEKTDIQILKQIFNGYHLEPKEVKRVKELLYKINLYLKQQTK